MNISFTGTSNKQVKEPKYRNKGYLRGNYAYSLATAPAGILSGKVLSSMKKVSKLSADDSIQLREAAQEGLKRTGLFDKGVRTYTIKENPIADDLINAVKKTVKGKNSFQEKILKLGEKLQNIFETKLDYAPEDSDAINALKTELSSSHTMKRLTKHPVFSDMKDTITETAAKIQGYIFKEGMNACFLPHANAIITPDKSLQTSIFHEMGHAMNANGGAVLKSLQKMRPMATIVPAFVLASALLNKRKTTDEKLKNNSLKNRVQNVRDGVKRHAGLISAAAMLPMVVEEGIASIRGQGVAKNLVKDGLLSPETLKKIKLTNLGGFTTYFTTMIAVGLATKFAVQVKDKIQEKYEAKKLAKFEAKQAKKAAKA